MLIKYIRLLIGCAKKQPKRTHFYCAEEDMELIRTVFPEHGVSSYIPGLFIRILAESLRSHGITSALDRYNTNYAELSNFVSLVDSLKAQLENGISRTNTSSGETTTNTSSQPEYQTLSQPQGEETSYCEEESNQK